MTGVFTYHRQGPSHKYKLQLLVGDSYMLPPAKERRDLRVVVVNTGPAPLAIKTRTGDEPLRVVD